MRINDVYRMEMRDCKYYNITIFENKHRPGRDYKTVYWKKGNAIRQMNRLIESGKYQYIGLWENDISIRTATTEISVASCIVSWDDETGRKERKQ